MSSGGPPARQRVERVAGSRRARLTPAPGADTDLTTAIHDDEEPDAAASGSSGPNDDRLRRDVPPHY